MSDWQKRAEAAEVASATLREALDHTVAELRRQDAEIQSLKARDHERWERIATAEAALATLREALEGIAYDEMRQLQPRWMRERARAALAAAGGTQPGEDKWGQMFDADQALAAAAGTQEQTG